MALPSLKDAMTRATAGVSAAALAATLIASPAAVNDAQAQSVQPVSTQQPSAASQVAAIATTQAQNYSKKNGGVGIVLAYGGGPNMPSAEEIGNRLVGEFAKRNVKADFFVARIPMQGASVVYAINDVTIGPFGGREAFANIDKAVSYRHIANKIELGMAPN